MTWFLGTYTSRFNRRHRLSGHLLSGPYQSLVVEASGNGYLRTVCDYVHLNPARAKLLRPEPSLREYRWSSYPEYLECADPRVAWLRVDRLLGEWGIRQDDAAGRRRLAQAVEERRAKHQPEEWKEVRRGWFLGTAQDRRWEGEAGQAVERPDGDDAGLNRATAEDGVPTHGGQLPERVGPRHGPIFYK